MEDGEGDEEEEGEETTRVREREGQKERRREERARNPIFSLRDQPYLELHHPGRERTYLRMLYGSYHGHGQ